MFHLVGVAALAAYLPTRRGAHLDPPNALRYALEQTVVEPAYLQQTSVEVEP